jgi:hypothetical protein
MMVVAGSLASLIIVYPDIRGYSLPVICYMINSYDCIIRDNNNNIQQYLVYHLGAKYGDEIPPEYIV